MDNLLLLCIGKDMFIRFVTFTFMLKVAKNICKIVIPNMTLNRLLIISTLGTLGEKREVSINSWQHLQITFIKIISSNHDPPPRKNTYFL